VRKPNRTFRIEEVERRPVLVRETIPDGVLIIDAIGLGRAHRRKRATDVLEVVLETELGVCAPITTSPC